MNRFYGVASAVILVMCVVGCNKFGPGSSVSDNSNAKADNTASKPVVKAVDIPPLVGKTVDEIKKVLGPPTRELAGRFTWEFPQGDLAAETDYKDKTKNKVEYLEFTTKIFVVGKQTAQGYADYQRLGDLVGIETKGKTPTSDDTGDTGYTTFEKFESGGKPIGQVRFNKVSGDYLSVIVQLAVK